MKEKFQGQGGHRYRLVETEDGSSTLWSEKFDEHCHSLEGATAETKFLYVHGLQIAEKAQRYSPLNILEVGYGLGRGLEVTLKLFQTQWPQGRPPQEEEKRPNFFSLEQDPALVEWGPLHPHPLQRSTWRGIPCYQALFDHARVVVLIGDARRTAKALTSTDLRFHAFYQDPFSPKKNPELWTEEWFTQLRLLSDSHGHLATFSASPCVHRALERSGWTVIKRPGFGSKRASTQAVLNGPGE